LDNDVRNVLKAYFKSEVPIEVPSHEKVSCTVDCQGMNTHGSEIYPSSPMSLETSLIHDRPKKQCQIIFIVFAQPN